MPRQRHYYQIQRVVGTGCAASYYELVEVWSSNGWWCVQAADFNCDSREGIIAALEKALEDVRYRRVRTRYVHADANDCPF